MELSPADVLNLPRQVAIPILEKMATELRQARAAAVRPDYTCHAEPHSYELSLYWCCVPFVFLGPLLTPKIIGSQTEARAVRRQYETLSAGKGDPPNACI